MIVATERKDRSPACLGRVLDFEQWPISTAVQHPTFWLELLHSMYPERIGAANGPTKNSLPGVAVLQRYEITLAAIKARSSSALIFRGE